MTKRLIAQSTLFATAMACGLAQSTAALADGGNAAQPGGVCHRLPRQGDGLDDPLRRLEPVREPQLPIRHVSERAAGAHAEHAGDIQDPGTALAARPVHLRVAGGAGQETLKP